MALKLNNEQQYQQLEKIYHSCQEAHIVTALGLAIFSFHLDINQYVAGTIVEHVLASVKNVSFRQC